MTIGDPFLDEKRNVLATRGSPSMFPACLCALTPPGMPLLDQEDDEMLFAQKTRDQPQRSRRRAMIEKCTDLAMVVDLPQAIHMITISKS